MIQINSKPPSIAKWLLIRLIRFDDNRAVIGDFQEAYKEILHESGLMRARIWYWKQVVSSFPSFMINSIYWNAAMSKSYMKTGFRNLAKNKTYTLVNISGLSLAATCILFMLLYIQDELSFDKFNENINTIYRVVEDLKSEDGNISELATSPASLVPEIIDAFPGIKDGVRFYPYSASIRNRDRRDAFHEDRFFFADSTVFDVFSFPLVRGDPGSALNKPFSMVISESASKKYFGNDNPIGKMLIFEDEHDFVITGVLKDVSYNSHIVFDFLASFSSVIIISPWIENWSWPPMYSYVLVAEEIDVSLLESQIQSFSESRMSEEDVSKRSFRLQPLADIHLRSRREFEPAAQGNINYILVFSAAAVLILITACFNFTTLSTARSINRAKEVGMRKVLGAHRIQLVKQFLSESFILTFFSILIAMVLVFYLLPSFNSLAGKNLSLSNLPYGFVITVITGIIFVIGLLAGSYPSFYLSAFRPVKALQGSIAQSGIGTTILKNGLIAFQFAVSSILIIGTGIIFNQLDYIQNADLGFERKNIITIPLGDFQEIRNFDLLKQEWLKIPSVSEVSISSGIPTKDGLYDFQVIAEGSDQPSILYTLSVDHDFPKTYEMELVEGRFFSDEFSTDIAEAFLINESAAQLLGWQESVGKKVILTYFLDGSIEKEGTIVGVFKDLHYYSLHQKVNPMIVHVLPPEGYRDFISAKINSENTGATLKTMEDVWKSIYTNDPFPYSFLNETINELYKSEQRLGEIFTYYSFLGIFIAGLGLFGLTSLTAKQRTKEIGIRKVLGASLSKIFVLLTKDLFYLVLIGILISIPIVYFGMNSWLQNFAYRVTIGWSIFLYSSVFVLIIALFTILYHSLKATRVNPAETLRHE